MLRFRMSVVESHGGILQPWGWENITEAEDDGLVENGSSTTHSYELERAKHDSDAITGGRRTVREKMSVISMLVIGAIFLLAVVGIISQIVAYEVVHGTAAVAIRCVDNSACASIGMVGDCCPTSSGQRLACCNADDNYVTRHITKSGACDDNSACAKLGIAGMCCPTSSGTDLACCSEDDNTVRKPHAISATCSTNSACHFSKLSGNCCPTDDGSMLGCCPPGAADEDDEDDKKRHQRRLQEDRARAGLEW